MIELLKDDKFCEESTKLMYEYIQAMDKCDIGISSNKYSFSYYYDAMKQKGSELVSYLEDKGVREDVADYIIGASKGNHEVLLGLYSSFSSEERELIKFLDPDNVNKRHDKKKHDELITAHKEKLTELLKKYKSAVNDIDVFYSGDLNDEKYWRALIEAKDNAFIEMKALGFNNPTIRDIFEGLNGSYDYVEYPEESADNNIIKAFIKAAKKK